MHFSKLLFGATIYACSLFSFVFFCLQSPPIDPFYRETKPSACHGVPLGGMGLVYFTPSILEKKMVKVLLAVWFGLDSWHHVTVVIDTNFHSLSC